MTFKMKTLTNALAWTCCLVFSHLALAGEPTAQLENLSVNGAFQDGKARLTIEGWLLGGDRTETKPVFTTTIEDLTQLTLEKSVQTIILTIDILQGEAREIAIPMYGGGEIRTVVGENLLDWSVRKELNGSKALVLRTPKGE